MFKSDGYYQAELANLKNDIANIDGIEITNDDLLRYICLSFLTRKALKKFRDDVGVGSTDEETYTFKEFRRNRKKEWVFVTKPILWEDRLEKAPLDERRACPSRKCFIRCGRS